MKIRLFKWYILFQTTRTASPPRGRQWGWGAAPPPGRSPSSCKDISPQHSAPTSWSCSHPPSSSDDGADSSPNNPVPSVPTDAVYKNCKRRLRGYLCDMIPYIFIFILLYIHRLNIEVKQVIELGQMLCALVI